MYDKPEAFSKEWFKKHQRPLLLFANTRLGRHFFRISKDVPKGKKLIEIAPGHITWPGSHSREFVTDFRGRDKFAARLYYGLKPLWYSMHYWDVLVKEHPKFSFGFSTLTAYPAVGSNSPVNGVVSRSVANESFATMSNGNGDSFANDPVPGNNLFYYITHGSGSPNFSGQTRSIYCFDTSALTSAATISAAVLSTYGSGANSTTLGTPALNITAAAPASTSTLAAGDYQTCSFTAFASIANASWSTSAYNDFTLDSGGRGNISKTGISKFAGMTAWDAAHSFGGSWAAGDNYAQIEFSNHTGTSQDPKLVVTYTIPVAPTVTTNAVTNISGNQGTGNGDVTDDGGATVTERGVVVSTSINPTTSNSKYTTSGTTGAFSVPITGLNPNATYHVRAYAINAQGTSYGSDVTFTTIRRETPSKYHVYHVFRNGAFLGLMPNVLSSFGYQQLINSGGAQLALKVAIDPDTPGQTPVFGSSDDEILIRNGNQIKVYEISDNYPNGKLMFDGRINRWDADFNTNVIEVIVLSQGLDLDNYVVQGEGEVLDVSQTSAGSTCTLQNKGNPPADYESRGQTWQVTTGVDNIEAITIKINTHGIPLTIRVKVFPTASDAWYAIYFDADLLGVSSQVVNTSSLTDVKFYFTPAIAVSSPISRYFHVQLVDVGDATADIAYAASDAYANGDMYVTNANNGVPFVTPIGDIAQNSDLYFKTYYSGNSVEFTYSADDPTAMLLDMMGRYTASGGLVQALDANIDDTGVSATYTFRLATALEVIKKVAELSPSGWFWYVDVATNYLFFKDTSATPTYRLIKGKHFTVLKMAASIEHVINDVYFSGGPTAGVNLFRHYSNGASIGSFGPRLKRLSDNRVTLDATADLIGNNTINTSKDEQYQTTLTIAEGTIDITLFKPGDTIGFEGFQTFIDDLILQVVAIDYSPDKVQLTVGILPPRVDATLEQLQRDVQAQQSLDNPASYS